MRVTSLFAVLLCSSPLFPLAPVMQGDGKPATPSSPHPAITALAYSPDGKLLIAGMRGEVQILDADTGDVFQVLTGQGPKVTAESFSKDGKLLAVASGTPGKSGEVRFYTVNDWDKPLRIIPAHQDLVHALAFSPDGKLLATCSYDRLVKLWEVSTGKLVHTLQDHSDAVYGVAFHPEGKLLATCAADRAVKVWEVATGKRLYSLGEATDWLYTLAWSPDGKRLAAGGVDKSIRVWEATAEQGRLVQSAFAHEKAVLQLTFSKNGTTLYSLGEDRVLKAWDSVKLTERQVYPPQPEAVHAFALHPEQLRMAMGRFDGKALVMELASGKTVTEPLPTRFSLVREQEPNDISSQAQTVKLPAMVSGKFDKAGDVDCYRFLAQQNEALGLHIVPAPGSTITPEVELINPHGHVIATAQNGALGCDCIPGWYVIKVRDREFKGGKDAAYRLKLGPVPVITTVFPLGLQRGTKRKIEVRGVHLAPDKRWGHTMRSMVVEVEVPKDAAIGSRIPLPLGASAVLPVNNRNLIVGEFPDTLHYKSQPSLGDSIEMGGYFLTSDEASQRGGFNRPPSAPYKHLPAHFTINGFLRQEDEPFRFQAKKGQPLVLEVEASRLGSPLDSVIEILDTKGKPLPRAVLRSVGLTYSVFRDHDANGGGIRIESWNNLAMNDYLYVGTQLLRIRELPKNPDDDCVFWSEGGRRKGFLGTTTAHLALGMPMYKVELHPPGSTFPPNGYPVFTIPWRNDDGGAGFGKDSNLLFDPPADGEYMVRVTDAQGRTGPEFAYRLTIRPPRPGYTVDFNPKTPAVWKGGAVPITVSCKRLDGYTGPIDLQLTNLPAGFHAPTTTIPAGEESTVFALFAEKDAAVKPEQTPLKLIAKAVIDGKENVQEVQGKVPKAVEPGEIVTTAKQSEISVLPGGEVRVTVEVERRKGFMGRIPLEVRGLPHGVRVLDIGLNGILITEKETVRSFVIYCEPWVRAQEHPIVILAKLEGKNTDHAAKSVLLRIVPRK